MHITIEDQKEVPRQFKDGLKKFLDMSYDAAELAIVNNELSKYIKDDAEPKI